jgi:two-component sensor histidine kinase
LSELDIPQLLSGVLPRWASEFATALTFVAAASILRIGIDAMVQGVAPFILLFPAILGATLLSGWRSGAATIALSSILVWRFVMVPADPADIRAAVISTCLYWASGGLLIVFASAFRTSARKMSAERQRKVEERDLLLREFNHRVKNDFQTLSSVLQLQLRRSQEPAVKAALAEAIERLQGVAQVHASLYAAGGQASEVDIRDYLIRLCEGLSANLLAGTGVTLQWRFDSQNLPRDRAAVLGLIVNELATNAIKHAFPDGVGSISVSYEMIDGKGRLVVVDDGRGLPAEYESLDGVGRKLVAALAKQAGGKLTRRGEGGARFQLDGIA